MPRIVIPARRGILVAGIAIACVVLAGAVWLVVDGDWGLDHSADRSRAAATSSRSAGASAAASRGPQASTGAGASGAPSGAGAPVPGRGTPSPGTPSDDATSGFLTEVAAINPALVTDPGHAVAAGKGTCEDIGAHKPDEEIVKAARERFAVQNVAITDVTAVLLVGASRNHLCPA